MQVRLPWILSRRRLITAAVLDGALFTTLYYLLFHRSFDRWPGLSFHIALLLIYWLLTSYVVGRFTSGDSKLQFGAGVSFIRQIYSTALVLVLSLAPIIFYLWVNNQYSIEDALGSFLITFIFSLAVLSSAVQFLVNRVVSRQYSKSSHCWSFIGSQASFEELVKSLEWSRTQVSIISVLPSTLSIDCPKYIVYEDEIISQDPQITADLLRLQQNGSIVLNRFDWCELLLQRFPPTFLAEADLLRGFFTVPTRSLQFRLKRISDVVVAFLLLLITTPLIFFAAILIKLSDDGPIFYSHIRTGLLGQPYRIWKLRSMRVDAEKNGAKWSSRSDSRITKIGAILRRTRIDELPQLWCVLVGHMSLIGPRPERPEFDSALEKEISHYSLRYNIRPGLSGWAQVNYPYGASVKDSANKLSYDLYYLRNFSFWFDLLILFKTIRLVFNVKGSKPQQ